MADPIEIGKRIKYARELKDITQEQLGNEIGLNKSTIQRYETGQVSKIKIPVLESIAKCLNVNPEWLALKSDDISIPQNTNNSPKNIINDKSVSWRHPIPVYKSVKFYNDDYKLEDFVRYTYIDDIEDFDNYIALLIPGNEFAPNFSENDIAIIHKQTNLEDKKYFYIVLKNNTHTIRKIIHQNNTLILQSDNSDLGLIFANENEVTIIGKVVAIQKSLKLE